MQHSLESLTPRPSKNKQVRPRVDRGLWAVIDTQAKRAGMTPQQYLMHREGLDQEEPPGELPREDHPPPPLPAHVQKTEAELEAEVLREYRDEQELEEAEHEAARGAEFGHPAAEAFYQERVEALTKRLGRLPGGEEVLHRLPPRASPEGLLNYLLHHVYRLRREVELRYRRLQQQHLPPAPGSTPAPTPAPRLTWLLSPTLVLLEQREAELARLARMPSIKAQAAAVDILRKRWAETDRLRRLGVPGRPRGKPD